MNRGVRYFSALVLAASISIVSPLQAAQTVPKLDGVVFRATTQLDQGNHHFATTYKLGHSTASQKGIVMFEIDLRIPPDSAAQSSEGLILDTKLLDSGSRTFDDDRQEHGLDPSVVVPAGCLAIEGWRCTLTAHYTVMFEGQAVISLQAGTALLRSIEPGSQASGYQLVSPGLPGIRNVVIEPLYFYTAAGHSTTKEDIELAGKLYEEVKFRTKTVGPTAPPKVFDPVKYVEYMQSLRSESFELHWIKDSYTASELGGKLSAISGQLSALTDNKIPLSKGNKILELGAQFLQFVESNSCKDFDCAESRALTAESYALLFYNMDYFLSQVRKACENPTQFPLPSPSPAPKRKK